MDKNILKKYFKGYENLVNVTDVTIDDNNNTIISGLFDHDENDIIKGYHFEIKINSKGETFFRNCGYSPNCYWTQWQ